MCSHRVSVTLVADTGQTPKVQLSMLDDCCGLVVNMVEAFVYCWQVMRIWERKEIMGKPMMPIWMMTGVLTMSKAVAGCCDGLQQTGRCQRMLKCMDPAVSSMPFGGQFE